MLRIPFAHIIALRLKVRDEWRRVADPPQARILRHTAGLSVPGRSCALSISNFIRIERLGEQSD